MLWWTNDGCALGAECAYQGGLDVIAGYYINPPFYRETTMLASPSIAQNESPKQSKVASIPAYNYSKEPV